MTLSQTDRRIVLISLSDVTPETAARIRKIHEDALAELRPQHEATGRAIAMREYALQKLIELEARGAQELRGS